MSGLKTTFIADEEGGSAVAVCIDLPSGDQVWSGDVSKDLFDQQDDNARGELLNDYGSFVVHASVTKGVNILARAADRWSAMDLATAYAEWLHGHQERANPVLRDE